MRHLKTLFFLSILLVALTIGVVKNGLATYQDGPFKYYSIYPRYFKYINDMSLINNNINRDIDNIKSLQSLLEYASKSNFICNIHRNKKIVENLFDNENFYVVSCHYKFGNIFNRKYLFLKAAMEKNTNILNLRYNISSSPQGDL